VRNDDLGSSNVCAIRELTKAYRKIHVHGKANSNSTKLKYLRIKIFTIRTIIRWANSTHPEGGYINAIMDGRLHKNLIHVSFVLCFTSFHKSSYRICRQPNIIDTQLKNRVQVIIDSHELRGFSKMNPQATILWKQILSFLG